MYAVRRRNRSVRPVVFFTLAACVQLLVLACRDSTAPDVVDVTMTLGSVPAPVVTQTVDGAQIACEFPITVAASGSGSARWTGSTYYWFAGADSLHPFDSTSTGADDISAAWGDSVIRPGASEELRIRVSADIPFGARLALRYRAGGSERASSVVLTCMPPGATAGPKPVVSAVHVQPAAGVADWEDSLVVDYTVTGSSGLWESYVRLAAPCGDTARVFFEGSRTVATHHERRTIPAACPDGVSPVVEVGAMDDGGRIVDSVVATQLRLVDTHAPSLGATYSHSGSQPSSSPSGVYFAGDTMSVVAEAVDNHALRSLVWETQPGGIRDSLPLSGRIAYRPVTIVVPTSWVGSTGLQMWVTDAAGLRGAVTASRPNAFQVVSTTTRAVSTLSVSGEVAQVLIDPRRDVMYLVQSNQSRFAVVSRATMSVTSTISVPAPPIGAMLTQTGDSLIFVLGGEGRIGVLDLRSPTPVLTSVPVPGLDASLRQYPSAVTVLADGRLFVALSGTTGDASRVLEMNLATGLSHLRTDINGGGPGGALAESGDGRVVVANAWHCVQRYDLATDAFGACHADVPGVVLDATGAHALYWRDVFDADLHRVQHVASPINENSVGLSNLSPDGTMVYQSLWFYGVVRTRVSDGAIVDVIPTGLKPTAAVLWPDGSRIVEVENDYGTTSRVGIVELR